MAELRASGPISALNNLIQRVGVRKITVSSVSSSNFPITVNNARIKANHAVVKSVLSNPSAQTSDWTVVCDNGTMTIGKSGETISGTTDITLYLSFLQDD